MALINGTSAIVLIVLSLIDTVLTYEWAKLVLKRKPNLPLKKVEMSPLIRVCWNNYGIGRGSIVSGILLLTIQILLSSIHKYAFYIIIAILTFAVYNHANNFYLVNQKRILQPEKDSKKSLKKSC